MKTNARNIILIAIISAIIIAYASKKIADARRSRFAKKSYGDKNIATAQRLYNALYPDGKPKAKFSVFNPLFSSIGLVKDMFKSNPDTDKVMSIARNINPEDFNKISKGYRILYRSDLLLDLQNELKDDFTRFDDILKSKVDTSDYPEKNKRKLKSLANRLYTDLHAWGLADDDLYQELYDLPDNDFLFVYDEFRLIADNKGTKDSLAKEIADDSWSIDLSTELKNRFIELGLL